MIDLQETTQHRLNRKLTAFLILALALRLGWGVTRTTDETALKNLPDQREYLDAGRSLLRERSLKFLDPRFDQVVYAYRTPGYPALIAACGGNVSVLRIVQALFDTSTVLAAYLLARRWLSERACLFAAFLVAVNPYLIYFSGLVLTETLFTAMLAWGAVLLLRNSAGAWLGGALLLSLAILVRPGAIGLPVLLGISSALLGSPGALAFVSKSKIPVGTATLVLTVLVLLPWAARNRYVLGRWIWTSTNGGMTRYDGFNPDADAASEQDRIIRSMPQIKSMDEVTRDSYLNNKAQEFIRENPVAAVKLGVGKIARTWSPMPLSAEFGRPMYVVGALAYSVPFFLLTLVALYTGALPRGAKIFLMLPAIYFTASAAMSVGSLRYRVPAEVFMAVVASSVRVAPATFRRYEEQP